MAAALLFAAPLLADSSLPPAALADTQLADPAAEAAVHALAESLSKTIRLSRAFASAGAGPAAGFDAASRLAAQSATQSGGGADGAAPSARIRNRPRPCLQGTLRLGQVQRNAGPSRLSALR